MSDASRDAIFNAIYDNTSPADQFTAVLAALPVPAEVWILDLVLDGPEGGDIWAWRSVHASREGAVGVLLDKLGENGIAFGGDVDEIASVQKDDGSVAGDFMADDVKVGYGVQRDEVAP
ncbi:hypothetical protein SEA_TRIBLETROUBLE_38 [Mycobacterium Phage TribleTrouble]|nr:hypothetical protein SEA_TRIBLETROUBLE_38 [Mycobacterium Phage TribleTrouble]